MNPSAQTPPDLLEQAHLALLRGNLGQARSVLERLIASEPDNVAAQDLRATVIAKQAALAETARLQAADFPSTAPPVQAGSIWTSPLPDPISTLIQSSQAKKWPKPLLLIACLLVGILSLLLPGRHHHYPSYHSSWIIDIVFGLGAGVVLFIWIVMKRR